MEQQLLDAIKDGDFEGVKVIMRDENLIHRINTITDNPYPYLKPLHLACR